ENDTVETAAEFPWLAVLPWEAWMGTSAPSAPSSKEKVIGSCDSTSVRDRMTVGCLAPPPPPPPPPPKLSPLDDWTALPDAPPPPAPHKSNSNQLPSGTSDGLDHVTAASTSAPANVEPMIDDAGFA